MIRSWLTWTSARRWNGKDVCASVVSVVGTQYFSPNELLKPLFNLFAGIPGGCQFRREMHDAVEVPDRIHD